MLVMECLVTSNKINKKRVAEVFDDLGSVNCNRDES